MTAPAPEIHNIDTGSFKGMAVGAPSIAAIVSAVIGGSPYLDSLTRLTTTTGKVAWPSVKFDDPEWVDEMGLIPLLSTDTNAYVVAVSKLAGIILISNEMVTDAVFPVTSQVETSLRDSFSGKAERDLINGDGSDDGPTGVLANAPTTAGEDLWAAAVAAKAEINGAGGQATMIALNAGDIGAEEGRRNNVGDPLYPQGLTQLAGLTVVPTRHASRPIVYDRTRVFCVIRQDWQGYLSTDYGPAFERYAVALRLVGRLTVAVPMPERSIRALDVPAAGGALTVGTTKTAAAAKKS